MAIAIARAKSLRISPRKLRLVADLIRGRKVVEARSTLRFVAKGGAPLLSKVLESAVANAEHEAAEAGERIDTDEMVIKKLVVDEGRTMRGFLAAPRMRAMRTRKRTSHIELVIGD